LMEIKLVSVVCCFSPLGVSVGCVIT
jgi:hypothetical protein